MRRLLVLDLDGTLIDRRDKISNEKLEVIEKIKEKYDITLATGRSYLSAFYFAKYLDINIPIICFDGSLVCDIKGNDYFSYYIGKIEILEILNFVKKFKNCSINVFYKEKTLSNLSMLSLGISLKHWKINQKIYLNEINSFEIYKIVLASYNYKVLSQIEMFLKDFRIGYYTYPSAKRKGVYVMDVFNKFVSKGKAIEIIKKLFRYDFIVSVGDYINDLEMFKVSDVSIAPLKSHRIVRETANYVISDFSQIVEILKNYD